jgi:hypothetical protein
MTSLIKALPDIMKDKYLVTDVKTCPSYAMVISSENAQSFMPDTEGESISVSLAATIPAQPDIAVGEGAALSRTLDAVHGMHRSGSKSDAVYSPLYTLRAPPYKFWQSSGHKRVDADVIRRERVEK